MIVDISKQGFSKIDEKVGLSKVCQKNETAQDIRGRKKSEQKLQTS